MIEPEEEKRWTRNINAMVAAAGDDADAFAAILALYVMFGRQLHETAIPALRQQGFSWSEIARPLGISKQAAQQRWG
jgi:hypothetical protein